MNINEIAKLLEPSVPLEVAKHALQLPVRLCPEEVQYAVPSFVLRQDGPAIQSIFLFMTHLICEVRLDRVEQDFDFADTRTVIDYRVKLWEHRVEVPKAVPNTESVAPETIVYQVASVILTHSFGIQSEINYIGGIKPGSMDRATWAEDIVKHLPVSIVSSGF